MALLLASIVHHFWKYLEFFEFFIIAIILFEYIVLTFLTIFLTQIFPLNWRFQLLLFLHIQGKILPKTLTSLSLCHFTVQWSDGALLLILTWKGLTQCKLNLLLSLIIILNLISFGGLWLILKLHWILLKLRIILTWMPIIIKLSSIWDIFFNIILILFNVNFRIIFCLKLQHFARTIILRGGKEPFYRSGGRIF